jgi:hypothetical protein
METQRLIYMKQFALISKQKRYEYGISEIISSIPI